MHSQLRMLASEFAAPLQYIAAASEFVASFELDAPEIVGRQLRTMQLTSSRLLQMTELLLLHDGVMAGQLALKFEPINVAALAQEAYTTRLRLHQLRPTNEYVTVTKHAWPAQSDRKALRAALEALSDVLIQTGDMPLSMTSRLVQRGEEVHLEFTDSGPVIRHKDIMAANKNQQPYKGVGLSSVLSMSIASDLVTSLKGRITIAKTDSGRRHTVVRLPMTTQLGLLEF